MTQRTRDLVLIWLHLAIAVILLVLSFLLHGTIPGLSADESAALGFLLFFVVGLPLFLIGIAVCAVSLFAGGRHLGILALAMILTAVLAVSNKWTGIASSLAYLFFAIWVLVQKGREPMQPPP